MKTSQLFAILLFLTSHTFAQSSPMAKKVFHLLNVARTHPATFLQKHRSKIEKLQPRYIKLLSRAKPLPPMKWLNGLEQMCIEKVEHNNLNPKYKGNTKVCGWASSHNSGNISKDPLSYVCHIFQNIHIEDNAYVGLYFNKQMDKYSLTISSRCDIKKYSYTYEEKLDLSSVDFDKLNTAKDATYLSKIEKQMITEVNFVRAYPKVYATLVKKYLHKESRSYFGLPQDEYEAAIELIEELENLEPVGLLHPRPCIYGAARKHGLDCQKRGFFDHTGSDGSSPYDRVKAICKSLTAVGENGAGNAGNHPRFAVMSLMIDSGISGRGHRYNIQNKDWKYIGVFRYDSKTYKYGWVQNFAY